MKTQISIRQKRRGSAVIVVLTLVFIMVLFVAANTATVNWLKAQVSEVEKHQVQRLQKSPPVTQPLSK